jgi:hypothetical protein
MGFRSRNIDDIRDRVHDTYSTAADRVGRATDAVRGDSDSQLLAKAIALAIGVGVGIGIGLLIAPASGADTRSDIADKVSDIGERMRERVNSPVEADPGS